MVRRIGYALLLLVSAQAAMASDLTLKRVMLSSGGVGYFEFAADVSGNATIGLDVPLAQVDDVLKSLVVFDRAGGVASVELPGRDNSDAAFGDVPFGREALQSPVDYLNALQGTEVTIQGTKPMTGRILRAEPFPEGTEKSTTQRTRVTLLSAEGLRQFVLEDAETVQVTDPGLRARIDRALESMRQDAAQSIRHLSIRLKGEGARTVTVGYVAGAPLWKTTYRLMLPETGVPNAHLQGWATLENQSGTDWKGVALTLQYGNPVAFRQALYRSYFVQRPEVPVEILGRVLPDIDTRAQAMDGGGASRAAAPPMQSMALAKSMPMAPAPASAPASAPAGALVLAQRAEPVMAEETAEETVFTLSQPVDLAAGHSANIPIIDREIPASRIGLVQMAHPHPLSAIRIRNEAGPSLPAGVLTLYDARGSVGFAGDARLGGLPAGESRLLSFARDLRTTIETSTAGQPEQVTSFSVADGVLIYTVRARQAIRIKAIAPAREARDLLLELPKASAEQTLSVDEGKAKVSEMTATAWRLGLSLGAGATETATVFLDQPVRRSVRLLDGDDATLQVLIIGDRLNAAGQTALRRVLDLRRDEARKQAELAQLRRQMDEVQADEDRIRKNLAAVSAGDALRTRLTKALDADETRIEQVTKAMADAAAEVDKAHRALVDAVTTLRL